MAFSDFFHTECDSAEPQDALNHVVISSSQWRDPRLKPQIVRQRVAVMYADEANPTSTKALERAPILVVMSPEKVIAVREDQLYLFLDSGLSSFTFRAIAVGGYRADGAHSA